MRASTQRQGVSGLGLESQQAAVIAYAERNGGRIVKSFQEVESGKIASRPILAEALNYCRRVQGTLVVAKLDRLSRDTRFLLGVLDSGVQVAFCDLPQLGLGNPTTARFFVTMLAAVAELEGRLISQRTKDALAQRRARGLPMGGVGHPNRRELTVEDQRKGGPLAAAARRENDRRFYEPWLIPFHRLWQHGRSFDRIAAIMNRAKVPTRSGRPWDGRLVQRVCLPPIHEAV